MKKKIISMFLLTSLVSQTVANNNMIIADAKENTNENPVMEVSVPSNCDLIYDTTINVDQTDSDNDGLIDYWEEMIGTDPFIADTDADGLSDFDEVSLTGTDPLLADTDENGILDADEDADADGLTNLEEITLGTNPLSADTDFDTLTDYDEVNYFFTSPILADTNGDGVSDSDELNGGVSLLSDMDEEELVDSKNEIVGQLRLVGRHSDDAIFAEGHSYLVFTSYIDDTTLTVDNLYNYYLYNGDMRKIKDLNELSWITTVDEITDENKEIREKAANEMWVIQNDKADTITLDRGEFATIGNYTMTSYQTSALDALTGSSESGTLMSLVTAKLLYEKITGKNVNLVYVMTHYNAVLAVIAKESYIDNKDVIVGQTDGGIWFNREMYNQKFQYKQFPNTIYEIDITRDQYEKMQIFLSNNNYYSVLNHNCASVAAGAWNAALGYDYDTIVNGNYAKSPYYIESRGEGIFKIMDLPGSIKNSIRKISKDPACKGVMYDEELEIVAGTFLPEFAESDVDASVSVNESVENTTIESVSVEETSNIAVSTEESTTVEASTVVEETTPSDASSNGGIINQTMNFFKNLFHIHP